MGDTDSPTALAGLPDPATRERKKRTLPSSLLPFSHRSNRVEVDHFVATVSRYCVVVPWSKGRVCFSAPIFASWGVGKERLVPF